MKLKTSIFFILTIIMMGIFLLVSCEKATDEGFFDINTDGMIRINSSRKDLLPSEVVIPKKVMGTLVTGIMDFGFKECPSLTKVTIPSFITKIGLNPFIDCPKLEFIDVNPSNKMFASEEGVLIDLQKNSIVCYPSGKTDASYTIRRNVCDYAFYKCNYLDCIELSCYETPEIGYAEFFGNSAFEGSSPSRILILGIDSYDSQEWFLGSELSNLMWKMDSVPDVLIEKGITSIPDGAFSGCNRIEHLDIPEGVTSIGESAFEYCSSLESITIPEGVESIGDNAFSGCTSLKSIIIPEGVESIGEDAFSGCTSLESITIPEGVASIGGWAFYDCTSLESITIMKGITSIGDYAFSDCTSLESIIIPEGVESIGEGAFSGCTSLESITIMKGITSIGDNAFSDCASLESIIIPESVTSIGEDAFYGCTSLKSITIPESVTSIGEDAFYGCTSLKSITIPEGVTSIGDNAFSGCASLESIIIPESVTSIGQWAFVSCELLTEMNIPKAVLEIGEKAFMNTWSISRINVDPQNPTYSSEAGILFDKDRTELIHFPTRSSSTEYDIPEGVVTIEDYAFKCTLCSKISIPDSVKTIGERSFYASSYLSEVSIGQGLERIGEGAFQDCKYLRVINYEGTMKQWEAITKGEDWDDNIRAEHVLCIDGNLPL